MHIRSRTRFHITHIDDTIPFEFVLRSLDVDLQEYDALADVSVTRCGKNCSFNVEVHEIDEPVVSIVFPACTFGGGTNLIHVKSNIGEQFSFLSDRCRHTRDCSPIRSDFCERMCIAMGAYIVNAVSFSCGKLSPARVPRFPPVAIPNIHICYPIIVWVSIFGLSGNIGGAFLPRRILSPKAVTPPGPQEVYIGEGHFRHRWRRSEWAVGPPELRGTFPTTRLSEVLEQALAKELDFSLLIGKTLVTDTLEETFTNADALACITWFRQMQQPCPIPRAMKRSWSQGELVHGMRNMLPQGLKLRLPFMEDIVNDGSLTSFFQWRTQRGKPLRPSQAPMVRNRWGRKSMRNETGKQEKATASSSSPCAPRVSFGLSPEEHFEASLRLLDQSLPTEDGELEDEDIHFCGAMYAQGARSLDVHRELAIGTLRELRRRLEATEVDISLKLAEIGRGASRRPIAFTAVLMILMEWTDAEFIEGLFYGFRAIGFMKQVWVFD